MKGKKAWVLSQVETDNILNIVFYIYYMDI